MTSIAVNLQASASARANSGHSRLIIGWSMMVVVLSVMAAKDVSHGDLPWPTAWICFLPSLLVLSLQSRLRCLFQATLAGVALAFIATWILHGHPLAEHLPYDSKFVPVAIAVVMTAALHIRFSLTRQRPA